MLQQFKRAIGVAIVRSNAKHKLARLHYVRATAAEAAYTCRTNHIAIRNGTHTGMDEQAGSRNMYPKDTELLNSSEMDMTSVYIECTQSHDMLMLDSTYICTKCFYMFNPT